MCCVSRCVSSNARLLAAPAALADGRDHENIFVIVVCGVARSSLLPGAAQSCQELLGAEQLQIASVYDTD